jgi:hypothetical protein
MQSDYIKKLEEANALLEHENWQLEKKVDAYNKIRNNLFSSLYACRKLIYEHALKESPKKESRADIELEWLLKEIEEFANKMSPTGNIDVSHGSITSYNTFALIWKHIKKLEGKSPLDKNKGVI